VIRSNSCHLVCQSANRVIWLLWAPIFYRISTVRTSATKFANPCPFPFPLNVNMLAQRARSLRLGWHIIYFRSIHCGHGQQFWDTVGRLSDCSTFAEFDSRTLGIVEDNDVHLICGQRVQLLPAYIGEGRSSVVESRSNMCYPGRCSHFGSQ
jgi:hypothetical protein